jgi:hypothetical protein
MMLFHEQHCRDSMRFSCLALPHGLVFGVLRLDNEGLAQASTGFAIGFRALGCFQLDNEDLAQARLVLPSVLPRILPLVLHAGGVASLKV